jgi:hypothetical protein
MSGEQSTMWLLTIDRQPLANDFSNGEGLTMLPGTVLINCTSSPMRCNFPMRFFLTYHIYPSTNPYPP